MKIKNILILIILTTITLHAQPMYYYYNGSAMLPSAQVSVAWNQTTINISTIPNINLPSTVSHMQANSALTSVINTWDFVGNYYNYTRNSNDLAVTIRFTDNINYFDGKEGSVGGRTSWSISENKYITYGSTGIILNNTAAFANNFNYTIFTPNPSNNEVHLQSVILHELGHVYGLSHNLNNTASAMYDTVYVGQVNSLQQDDEDGMIALYNATVYGVVGIEDCIFFHPLLSSYQTNSHYSSGSSYYLNFIDEYPYGDYIVSWDNWKCYASYGCGEVLIMDSQSFNIPSLPNGYNWERDANNNVIARMEKSGTDNDGVHHSTSAQIKISGVPNTFITSGTLTSNTFWCGNLTITGNIIIPTGKQLIVDNNSIITFTNNSSLIVNGNFICENDGYSATLLDFVSQNSVLKNGVKINPGGTASISNTIIKNAYNGVYINEGVLDISDSEIFDCYYGVHLYRTNYVSYPNFITNTHSYNNEFGVVMYYSKAHLSNNEFSDNWIGLGCADYSSPYLAPNDNDSESNGYNYIHNNDFGVYAYGYSNPFLGRETCVSFGGNNNISDNDNYEFFTHSNCNVYAENNYWGGGAPVRYVGSGCSFDYTPYLTSAPQMSQTSGISPEEEIFDIQFNQQLSKANNSTDVLELTNSDKPKGFNEKWSIEWKLLYARNLMRIKKYDSASKICEEVITNYPDSSLSYLALDLLHQARVSSRSKLLFSQFVKEKANKKVKKQIYGVAELLLAGGERTDRVAILDKIAKRYKNTPLIEFVLFQKFMYYLYEENNLEMAKSTSKELEKLFPKSESYFDSQRHLGNDVKRTLEPQLKKNASNEESFEVPKTYELLGNYPNPFNPSTTIKYALPYSSNVELTIYDITGKVVKVFEETIKSAGYQNIVWHGNNQHGSRVSSGVYFYRFKASSLEGDGKFFEKTAKMLLLK